MPHFRISEQYYGKRYKRMAGFIYPVIVDRIIEARIVILFFTGKNKQKDHAKAHLQ